MGVRAPTSAELRDDLAYVRALASGATATPPPHAVKAPPRRVFLTLHRAGDALQTSGLGATLAESLTIAARALPSGTPELADGRLEVDVATSAPTFALPTTGPSLGRYGAWVGERAFVLPSELLARHLLGDDEDPALQQPSLTRLLEGRGAASSAPRRTFSTVAAIETAAHDGASLLVRGRLPRPSPASIDAPLLRARVGLAASFLARATASDGKMTYLYDVATDRPVDDEYSIIRHAGATDALFAAYAELRDPALLSAGERALGFLDRALRTVAGDATRAYLPSDENAMAPIGGTGLALIAFAAHASATHDLRHLERMRSLGAFLVGQLDAAGRFLPYREAGASTPSRDVLYFPGEAMLGLLRLHALDPDARWLDAVERAARFRIETPYHPRVDAVRDYWFSLTVAALYARTGKQVFADRALYVADGAMREADEEEADFEESGGAFDATPRANPTSTYLEAIATDVPLARSLHRSDAALLDHARRAASFVVWQQLDAESAFRARSKEHALGAVVSNPWGTEARIDDEQHAIVALLALLSAVR